MMRFGKTWHFQLFSEIYKDSEKPFAQVFLPLKVTNLFHDLVLQSQ